jgi:putative spermidine/putrescine transport system permease protein
MEIQQQQQGIIRPARASWQLGIDKIMLFLVMVYLLVPLGTTLFFGLSNGSQFSFSTYVQIFHDPDFGNTLLLSFVLAACSTLLAVIVITPTAYWVQMRLPKIRPLMDVLTLLPFAVPPIVLSLGYLEVYGNFQVWTSILSLGLVPVLSGYPFEIVNTPQLLVFAYVIIALPFAYRPIDNSLRAINTRVLTEASVSLGGNWWLTFVRVILPNVWPGVISAALLTFSTAMGEFTIASLSGIYTFPVYLNEAGQSNAHEAASLTIFSFLITLLCILGLLFFVRRRSPGAKQQGTIEITAGR